jgi:hypothetical protein
MSYVIEDPEQFLKEAYDYLNSKGQNIWDNSHRALEALSGRGNEHKVQLVSNRLKNDPEFAKKALSNNPNVHFHEFSHEVRNNADVVKHAVSVNAEHMRFAGQSAKDDPKLAKAFLSSNALSDHTYNAFISKPDDYIGQSIAQKLGILDKLKQMKQREVQPEVKSQPQDALGLTNQRMKMK